MESNLLSRSVGSPISPGKRNLAISEIVIYSFIQIVQLCMRFMQEREYWHHDKRKSIKRCIFYSWWSMVGLLSQMRIAGSALVLASPHPSKSMVIAVSILQSMGLSPLLFEVSLVMLRCGQSGETGPGNSRWTKGIRFALHFFRFPIFISIVLAVVGSSLRMHALREAGSVVLVVAFAYGCGLVAWLTVKCRSVLPQSGQRGVLLVGVALPLLLIRIIYFLLLEYGYPRFNPASGDVRIMVGMGLVVEIIIVVLLLTARAVAEPVWPSAITKRDAYGDLESPAS